MIPSSLEELDTILLLRSTFLLLSATIILLRSIPPFAKHFFPYGPRSPPPSSQKPGILDLLASFTVPHGWFGSFYAFSLFSSLFWTWQLSFHGSAFEVLAQHVPDGKGTERSRTVVAMGMMALQGGRRLYECLYVGKVSKARMHVLHWVMGMVFYALIGIGVWIEGSPQLRERPLGVEDLNFKAPGVHTFVAVLMFILASGMQHDCHVYLASLKTYVVPEHPAFHQVVCPHYLAECVIYLAMAVEAAPEGHVLNRTVLCGVVFVAINLGITADGTKTWYETKFGPDSVKGKWRMIPSVF